MSEPASVPKKNVRKRYRTRVSHGFHDTEIHLLIDTVKASTFIWNTSHPQHGQRTVRRDKWAEIAENTFYSKFSPEEVQAKWENLRIQFRQNHQKSVTSKSGEATSPKPVYWRFYSELLFLLAADDDWTSASESNLMMEEDTQNGYRTQTPEISNPYTIKSEEFPIRRSSEFTDDEINLLIDAVQISGFLWDSANPLYSQRAARREKWNEISEDTFGGKFSPEEILAKWKNLRVQFRKNHLDAVTAKSGDLVTWRFYHKMLFLLAAEDQVTSDSESNLQYEEMETPEILNHHSYDPLPISPVTLTRKRRLYQLDSNMERTGTRNNFHRASAEKGDGYQIFGDFIASELRKIPSERDANRIQRKLNFCLLECLEELDNANTIQNEVR